ncbi:hypothetical protein A2U01_0019258, partial [Trifolium medium]|nr:hypothetical protein [Trifolium medium]
TTTALADMPKTQRKKLKYDGTPSCSNPSSTYEVPKHGYDQKTEVSKALQHNEQSSFLVIILHDER